MGHVGTHIGNGIYKVDEPFTVVFDSGLPSYDEIWAVGASFDEDNDDNIIIEYFTLDGDCLSEMLQYVFDYNKERGFERLHFYESIGFPSDVRVKVLDDWDIQIHQ